MKVIIADRIRELSQKKKYQLKEVAEAIGISQGGFQGILKNNSTTLEKLGLLAQFFKVPTDYFYEKGIIDVNESMTEYPLKTIFELEYIYLLYYYGPVEVPRDLFEKNAFDHFEKNYKDKDFGFNDVNISLVKTIPIEIQLNVGDYIYFGNRFCMVSERVFELEKGILKYNLTLAE